MPVDETSLTVSPNPVADRFVLNFQLPKPGPVDIRLFDAQGKLVRNLYSGQGYLGENLFSFNKENLSSGTYILEIKHNQNILQHEKIIVTE